MKKLIITEKPSVAREIARVLKCNQKQNGCFYNNQYVITWALGHLVTLALPEELNKNWEKWDIATLPMIPEKFETRVIKETAHQYNIVKTWLKNNEIAELIIATDAGREGELVARWIINKAGFYKPIKRLWISSMTDQAILQGFNNLKDASNYNALYDSAESRAIADWLVGLNITRALTCKYNAQLSAGRVQTPTLSFITKREEEIKKFTPVKYELIQLLYQGVIFNYYDPNKDNRFFKHEEVEKLYQKLQQCQFKIIKIDTNPKEEVPPLLYDLTSLQQDGNRLYGYSAKKTLDLIQQLYEDKKYLTYPRTDSKYLTLDMYDTIKERFLVYKNTNYYPYVQAILKQPLTRSKRIFNNDLVTDHHAIITTEERLDLALMNQDERRIYDLVCKRFLAAFMNNYRYLKTTITLEATLNQEKFYFTTSGKTVVEAGWKKIYQKEELQDSIDQELGLLPTFNLNDIIKPNITIKQGFTTPPNRYTEATLLGAMEHPEQFVNDKAVKNTLIASSGIGTPATRAEIIERLFSANYIELRGKTIYPTEKGLQVVKLVPNELCSPALTATWEDRLMKIQNKKEQKQFFIKDMIKYTEDLIKLVLHQEATYRHDNMVQAKCPVCGKNLLEVSNKTGKMLVCMDRSCNYRKPISRNTNVMCPNCHRKMVKIGDDEKSFYQCSCGFKEKVNTFHEKRANNSHVNKKAVDGYLRGKDNFEPSNNPFAELLKK